MIQTDGQAERPDQSSITMSVITVVQLESGFLVRVFEKYKKCLHKRLKN
jgi:hypothetical protein